MNKTQKTLLFLAAICATGVMIFLSLGYLSSRRQLSSLKNDLEISTAAWKDTNEKKLEVKRELKAAKEELREAELTLSESEEKITELQEEIAELEKDIQALQTARFGEPE